MAALTRQNYHEESEAGVNEIINLEMCTMYAYVAMASYYNRADVGLMNFAEYYRNRSKKRMENATKWMKFQNDRGGILILKDVKKPEKTHWNSGMDGMFTALELEKSLDTALKSLHSVADKHNDYHMSDFIEGNFLNEQVEIIKELSGHIANLKRVGELGHGEYHFDHATLSHSSC